ncbi:FCD domain-containing protein [Rhodococcus sp. NPDC059968]|uniref:FCD domain-containing protein n=1 Tax=Rhodococcus sp. NPDC059968 TaxID=3347017 RepID=UPI00366E1393
MASTNQANAHVTAWRAMLYAHDRLMKTLAEELQRVENLEMAWYEVLLHIAEAHGALTQRELQDRMLMGQSGLSRVLAKMEDAQLVQRGALESDRRNRSVQLTKRGRERLRRAAPVHIAGIKRWFGDQLTPGEAAAIESGLTKVLRGLTPEAAEELMAPQSEVAIGSSMLSTATDPVSVADTLIVRDALEPVLIADAARYATKENVGELRRLLGGMARQLRDPVKFLQADWQLHAEIAKITPNKVLGTTYNSLLTTLFDNVESISPNADLPRYLQDRLQLHADLVEAIAEGDVAAAEALAHEHRLTPGHKTDPHARISD